MKKLIPLILLATLVSCNESKGRKSAPAPQGKQSNLAAKIGPAQDAEVETSVFVTLSDAEFKQATHIVGSWEEVAARVLNSELINTKRGMVSLEKGSGTRHELDDTKKGHKVAEMTFEIKETILKIEGSVVYTLNEYTQPEFGTTRSVYATDLSDYNYLAEYFKKGEAKLEGNVLTIVSPKFEVFSALEGDEGSVIRLDSKTSMLRKKDMVKVCEGSTLSMDTEVSFTKNDQKTDLPDQIRESKIECAGILSAEELKKIDLTNVTFCDARAAEEERDCTEKDMSHLTSDL